MELVDVVFLDIDGVLLPFGGSCNGSLSQESKAIYTEGCVFPNSAMDALSSMLQRMEDFSLYAFAHGNSSAEIEGIQSSFCHRRGGANRTLSRT